MYDLAIDVLHDAGVTSYSIPTYLQNIITYAPLPIATHRECLQLIANAGRCVLYTGVDGEIVMRLQLTADVSLSDNGHYKWASLQGISSLLLVRSSYPVPQTTHMKPLTLRWLRAKSTP